MANAKTYALDPAFLTQAAISGKASIISDPASTFWVGLAQAANYMYGFEVLDTTATPIALDVYETRLTVSGTMAFTLPNGTVPYQRKRIVCDSAAAIPAASLTITTPETASGFACSAGFFFDTAGQAVELFWTGTKWRCTRVQRAGGSGVDGVVVGTTVINGGTVATTKNMWSLYTCSVSGTVSSTTTKAIPDGSAIGEIIQVGCSTAASIPSGTIACTGVTTLGAAGTKTLGTFNATTVWAALMWNGTGWQQAGGVTAVLA